MTLKPTIVFTLLLLLVCVPVEAQDVDITPQPEQGFIVRWAQDIIYPAGIRFKVTAGLPLTDLSSASLVIQPDTRSAVTIPLDLTQAAVIGGDNPQFEYYWPIPLTGVPLLFREIVFRWQFASAAGETARIEDRFTFQDVRVDWLRDLDIRSQIKLTLPNTVPDNATPIYNRGGIEALLEDMEKVADLLIANLNTISDFKFLIYTGKLVPACGINAQGETVIIDPVSRDEVPCDPAVAQAILDASGYTLLQSSSTGLESVLASVVPTVVRQSYAGKWAGKAVPEWFQNGLALFYLPDTKLELETPLSAAARTGSLLQVDAMRNVPAEGQNAELWQAQSYGMMLYMASQIGADGLLKLAGDIAGADSFDAAYQAAMGKSQDLLVGDFGRWLFTDAEANAFVFTPYDAATLTPTPSRTATLTRTPTATASPTLTVTPTVTGVLSLTPLPTKTLTRTPTAAPATSTPRPAGSLNTPTPVPDVPITAEAQNTLVIGVLLFLGGLVLVGIIALVLTRPRR